MNWKKKFKEEIKQIYKILLKSGIISMVSSTGTNIDKKQLDILIKKYGRTE